MAPGLDPAVIALLSLDPSKTTAPSSISGGDSAARGWKIETTLGDGNKKAYFMKTANGSAAEIMFQGEHESLNAIHNAVPSLCPASYGHGRLTDSPSGHFLLSDFIHISSRSGGSSSGSGMSLAVKMAKLHTTTAPTPQGYAKPMFGFLVTTCCGDTPQTNDFSESWAEFYKERRLKFILSQSEKNNGQDSELRSLVMQTCDKVVPRLIGDDRLNHGRGITPVVCHGDLWSGNATKGRIGDGEGPPEDLVFDSSAVYGHNEYDLGIMNMFGGFQSFFKQYHELCPKTEPAAEYDDRVKLYELYHHLNHHAMFGGGYKSGAMRIMRDLIQKYDE